MTLATHIIIATAVARPLFNLNPVFLFVVSLLSHYAADAIPHWDYRPGVMPSRESNPKIKIESVEFNYTRAFFRGTLYICIDFLLGLAVVSLTFPIESPQDFIPLFMIALGASLPDFMQGAYVASKMRILKPLQRLHDFTHSKITLSSYPLLGIPLQLIIFLLALSFI